MTSLARSGPWFAAFFAVALVAFWPTYLSRIRSLDAYTHAHALTAALWMLLLVAQPVAIRARRLELHRAIGRTSYWLAPLLVAAMLLLAHHRLQGLDEKLFLEQTYTLYLQVSLAALWTLCYAVAIAFRRTVALHARFMVCTALTLVDPVLIRFVIWANPSVAWNFQWLTFGITDLILVVLILRERNSPSGRGAFPAMLAVFILLQLPALVGFAQTSAWQVFSRWYAGLPLT